MAEAQEKITFELSAKGAEQTRRALEDTSTALKKADDRYVSLASSASRTASTVGALGGALGKISPEFNAFGQAVGRASGAIQNMTAVLGGGLAGIAIGGVIAVIGIFAEKMSAARKESEELAKAQVELAKATAKAAEEQLLAERALDAAAEKRARAFGKTPEVLSLEAELAQAREDRKRFGKKAQLVGYEPDAAGVYRPVASAEITTGGEQADLLDRKISDLERRLEAAKVKPAEEAAKNELELLAKRADAYKDFAELQQKREDETREKRKKAGDEEVEIELNRSRFVISELTKSDDERLAREKVAERKSAAEKERITQRTKDAREKAAKDLADVTLDQEQAMLGAGISTVQQLAKGQKLSAKDIIASIGDQMVALGTKHLFEGLATSANPLTPGLGAPLIAVATAEIAAGVALGAASSAGGAKGAPGGSGAPQQIYYVQDADGGYSRTAIEPASRPSTSMGGGASVVNINMPTVVSPNAQDGVRLRQAANEMRRQGL